MLLWPSKAAWSKASWVTSHPEEERSLRKKNVKKKKNIGEYKRKKEIDNDVGQSEQRGGGMGGGWRKGVKERRELSLGRLTINAYSMPNDLTFVRHSIHLLSKTHVQTHKA